MSTTYTRTREQDTGDEQTGQPIAVVTGAAGDLGSRLCYAFAELGWGVAGLDLSDPAPVLDGLGTEVLAMQLDLTDTDAVQSAFARVEQRFGGIDVLVNNAGLFHGVPRVPFWEIDLDTWRRMVDSHLTTAFLAARNGVPLLARRKGRVVNLSSSTAAFGMPNYLHYVTSKAGVVGMTRAMARELGTVGIAVNAVAPGLVHTEGNANELPEDYWAQVARGQCLAETIQPEQIVAEIVRLAAPATGITGQTIVVNNGATVGPF